MADRDTKDIPIELVQFLVIDDHSFVRHIVGECLRTNQIKRYTFAENGTEALTLISMLSSGITNSFLNDMIGARPDIAADLFPEGASFKAAHAFCIITDFNMGDVNGLEVLKAIRCGETRVPRDTPVILLTGFSDDFVVSTALLLDVNAFVLKPVSNRTLWEKIQRVLKTVSPAKDIEHYKDVEIPDDEGKTINSKKENKTALASSGGNLKERLLPLAALLPGVVLARDLYGSRGALLLREGTVITASLIHKLLDLAQMNALNGDIPVRDSSVGAK